MISAGVRLRIGKFLPLLDSTHQHQGGKPPFL